jgi:hypothetical protein
VLLQALRAAAGDLEHPHAADSEHPDDRPERGGSAEPPGGYQSVRVTSTSLADGLLVIAESFPADKVAATADPEVYQVVGWTCTTSSTGQTAATRSWTTWSACANRQRPR